MKVRTLIKEIPYQANVLALVSLVALLIKLLLLDKIPEIFFGAHAIGTLTESILLSVISGYIFFFFVEQLKSAKEVRVLSPFIVKKGKFVAGQATAQITEIAKASRVEMSLETIDAAIARDALGKINPRSNAPLLISLPATYANWFEFFQHYQKRTIEGVNRLQIQGKYLSPEISKIIAEIEDCSFFKMVNLNYGITSPSLAILAEQFSEYCALCNRLNVSTLGYESDHAS